MKPTLIHALIAGLLLGSTPTSQAHQGDRLYPIFELTDEDLARIDLKDGSIGEWRDLFSEPSLPAIEFLSAQQIGQQVHDPADLDFRIWLAWHDATNRIYGAMERVDDIYINFYDLTASVWTSPFPHLMYWHDSSIVFAIDGDHSGGRLTRNTCCGTEEEVLLYSQHAQVYTAIGELSNGGPYQVNIDLLRLSEDWGDWYHLPPYADAGGLRFGENPVVTVTEFYITPFDRMVWNDEEGSLISELTAGQIIGFYMKVTDRDEKENPHGDLYLPERYLLDGTADSFIDAILVGPDGAFVPQEDPDDTAVENVTWSRIKASLQMRAP